VSRKKMHLRLAHKRVLQKRADFERRKGEVMVAFELAKINAMKEFTTEQLAQMKAVQPQPHLT
jgi:3-methyladenine DNA glycosylase Tag